MIFVGRRGLTPEAYWVRSSIDPDFTGSYSIKVADFSGFLQILSNSLAGSAMRSSSGEIQVALVEHIKFDERGKHIRGTGRLNSRVPVAIEWMEAGRTLRAVGFTKDIGPKGCLAIVPQGFVVGQKLSVINLVNQATSEAVLVWRGHEAPAGWELGIELHEPPPDFWGLDF